MSIDDSDAPQRIAEAGGERAFERMQAAFDEQLAAIPELVEVDRSQLLLDVADAVERGGAALWRISLAEGAAAQFGVSVSEALAHPAVSAAEQLVGAPAARLPVKLEWSDEDEIAPAEPEPFAETVPTETDAADADADEAETDAADDDEAETDAADDEPEADAEADALRLGAVHTSGIEALRAGEDDLELRLSSSGLDVLKRSSGAAIGRLQWSEIVAVEVQPLKRGLRGRSRGHTLQVQTEHGQAVFALPDLSVQEADEHLRPTLQRLHGGAPAGDD